MDGKIPDHACAYCVKQVRARGKAEAFTLMELLSVVAVVVLLLALLFPAVGRAKESALRVKCVANLRAIGGVWQAYAADNNGCFPSNNQFFGGDDVKLGNWTLMYGRLHNALLPYVSGGGNIFFCPGYKFSREPKMFRQDLIGAGAYFQSYAMYAGQDYAAVFNTNLGNELPPAFRVTEASPKIPLLFDETNSDEGGKYSNHYDRKNGKPSGGNALYGDGHVHRRSFGEMIPVLKVGAFIRYY